MNKILLTGYSGFVGSELLLHFLRRGIRLNLLGRKPQELDRCDFFSANIDSTSTYKHALENVAVVVHCAARAHVMKEAESNLLEVYREVNLNGTLNLAKQAADLGVKRFVYLSSIKANGEKTLGMSAFTESVENRPHDPYGLSKFEAEQGLLELSRKTNMEVVVIRPPLVYGPSVKGNFHTIINLIKKGYPLPLALVRDNKRSLIALDNLIDFIALCADYDRSPRAANQTFVISDDECVSTAELFQRISLAYGKKSCLFPFPIYLLQLGAKVFGKQAMADRLLSSLRVDSSKAHKVLGWNPVVTMDEQLQKMAASDLREEK